MGGQGSCAETHHSYPQWWDNGPFPLLPAAQQQGGWRHTCWRRRRKKRRKRSSAAPGNAPLACVGEGRVGNAPPSCCWMRTVALEIARAGCDLHIATRRVEPQGPGGMAKPSPAKRASLHPRKALRAFTSQQPKMSKNLMFYALKMGHLSWLGAGGTHHAHPSSAERSPGSRSGSPRCPAQI